MIQRARVVTAILVAVGTVVLAASPAHAAPEALDPECLTASAFRGFGLEETGEFAGIEEIVLRPGRIPAPVRDLEYDCAITFDDGAYRGNWFELIALDGGYADAVAVLDAFDAAGWEMGAQVQYAVPEPVTSAEIDALATAEPGFLWFAAETPGQPDVDIWYSPTTSIAGEFLRVTVRYDGPAVGVDDPSTLSGLPTIAEKAPTPAQWGVIGAGSLMLMLVVGWPSALLNSVVGSRYQAMVRWVTGLFRPPATAKAAPGPEVPDAGASTPPVRRSRLPGWVMWPGFALAAILGAFVDPDFGANPMSLRLVVTLFLSFVLFNLLTWTLVRRIAVRLQPDSDPYMRFRWGSLLLVLAAVLIARLLSLEPGVVFGLVAGIAYSVTLRAAKSAVVTIVGSAIGLALAAIAWVAYSLLAPVPIDNVVWVFLLEFLAGVTVKGVSTLPLSLLPLGNLDGAKLFGWRKAAWGAAYVVGLAAFMIVLLTIPKAWGEIPGDFVKWLILFGVYALAAVIVWAVNARMLKKKPLPPEAQQGDQPDAITID